MRSRNLGTEHSLLFPHHIDGDSEVQVGVGTCPDLTIGPSVAVQAAASVRALCCFPSLRPSVLEGRLAKGLGSGYRAALKPAGWLDRKQL